MKIRVALSIDVDPEAYRAEYGRPDMTAAEIREEVRSSVLSAAATDGVIVPAGIVREVELLDR